MRNIMTFLLVSLMALGVFAQSYRVERRDMKLASQGLLEQQVIAVPVVADADRLLNDQATSDSVTTTVTSFLAQPDVARTLSVTTGGTTGDCAAGNVVVSGTNILNVAISESFAITANQAGATNGTKAFKSVTSILFPVQDGAGCTYDVGVLDALGLSKCLKQAGDVAWAVFNGAYEGTRPTCLADVNEVEKNTCDINGTLDGLKDVEIKYIQNFACGN